MAEEEDRFSFEVSEGKKEGSIFLEIRAGGRTPNQPRILFDLLKLLESQKKIMLLGENYSQHRKTLKSLELILSQGKVIVIKEQGADLYYDQVHGYSIHVRVEPFALSQEQESPPAEK